MKSNYSLSIIIPVYNGARCIGACLDSVLRQKNADKFQIIVVNDGSVDNTASVVMEYTTKHPNITLINQKNSGVSMARNTGINNATGDFITFIDADDMVGLNYSAYAQYFQQTRGSTIDNLCISKSYLPIQFESHYFSDNFFTSMLDSAKETHAEVIMGGKITVNYVEKYIKRHVYQNQKTFANSATDKDIILKQADCRETANFCLYSKELLNKHDLKFVKGMQLDEDILFCMLACLYAKCVATVPDATYLYNRHENSLSNMQFNEYSNQRYTLANLQRFSKLLVELSKYPAYASVYTHWLHVFSHECNKVPTSEYGDYFPPTRCAECPFKTCNNDCIMSTGDNYVLSKLRENAATLFR
jgi:glycosyltransferase involved in cell wall biosynthesis